MAFIQSFKQALAVMFSDKFAPNRLRKDCRLPARTQLACPFLKDCLPVRVCLHDDLPYGLSYDLFRCP